MADVEKHPGEKWAYREKPYSLKCPVSPVEILQLGPPRSNRVRVRHLDGEYNGLDVWVPRNCLRVPWNEAEAWIQDEERYDLVRRASGGPYDQTEYDAVYWLHYREGIPRFSIGQNSVQRGVIWIWDYEWFAEEIGWEPSKLLEEPLAYIDRDEYYVAPWATTLRVAQRVAEVFAEKIIGKVVEEETELRHQATHGYYTSWRGEAPRYMPPSFCAEQMAKRQPVLDLLREWCGSEAAERIDEIKDLRAEVSRLHGVVEAAATELDAAGRKAAARKLRAELGLPETNKSGVVPRNRQA